MTVISMAVENRDYRTFQKNHPSQVCEMRDVSLRKHPREFVNSDELIHRMRINFGGASRAKLNDAEGKKIERWLSEGSIFRAKATLFDP